MVSLEFSLQKYRPRRPLFKKTQKISNLVEAHQSICPVAADPTSLHGSLEPEEGDVGERGADHPTLRGSAPERDDLFAVVGSPRFEDVLPPGGEVRPASAAAGATHGQLHQDLGHPGPTKATLRFVDPRPLSVGLIFFLFCLSPGFVAPLFAADLF